MKTNALGRKLLKATIPPNTEDIKWAKGIISKCEHGVSRKKRCLECYWQRNLGAAIDSDSRRKITNRMKYLEARRKLKAKLRPLREAVRDARRLSADDYAIRINAKPSMASLKKHAALSS